jgi:hypothetical protein
LFKEVIKALIWGIKKTGEREHVEEDAETKEKDNDVYNVNSTKILKHEFSHCCCQCYYPSPLGSHLSNDALDHVSS